MAEKTVIERLRRSVEHVTGALVDSTTMLTSSPRSVVARLSIRATEGTREVVAKQVCVATGINQPSGAAELALVSDEDRDRDADERFGVELAAYRRLAHSVHVPTLVAFDAAERVFVLEYVGGNDIVPFLLGAEPTRAASALVAIAEALGEIHGAGMTPAVRPTEAALVAATRPRATSAQAGASVLAEATGVGGRWRSELDGVLKRLGTDGPWTTWLHGDPCPGNVIVQGDRAVLVDLESSAPGNAVLEAAYLRMAFPTCWCVGGINSGVLADAEAAYRDRLASSCPLAGDDDEWVTALADACCYWALEGNALVQRAERGARDLLRRALEKDWVWGTFSARQRLQLRLSEAARVAASAGDRPRLVELLSSSARLDALPTAPSTYPAL